MLKIYRTSLSFVYSTAELWQSRVIEFRLKTRIKDIIILASGFPLYSIHTLDAQKVKWNNERHILVLKHANERTSIIKYWPENSPFFDKEAILATASEKYFLIKDFVKFESNMEITSQRIGEKDKGCYEMWKKIKEAIESEPLMLNEMRNIDRQTYEVLSEVSL